LIDEAERVSTLKGLKESKQAVEAELKKLPRVLNKIELVKKKHDLEDKLNKINKGILTFSRNKVYVAID